MDAATWRALLARRRTTVPSPPSTSGDPGGSSPGGSSAGGSSGSAAGSSTTAAELSRYTATLLKSGSSGAAVLALQKALSVPGANGYFGPATKATVIAFQKAHRLSPDGLVGRTTWTALIAAAGGRSGAVPAASPPTTTPESTTPKSTAPATSSPTADLRRYAGTLLRPGTRGPAVLALQKALAVPGANGYFGPATKAAVIAFQKAHRLTPDGLVGRTTWTALIAG
jgi:peptidoglycan hydrolase-like protein with peptidoglycan-binding domain